MITTAQKKKIIEIVNVFETGSREGKYDALVIFPDGKGGSRQITYGRSQTTEQGNLRNLLERYIELDGTFASAFEPFMPKVGKVPLVDNQVFKQLLKDSGKQDPVMRAAQDEIFEVLYFQPAFHFFNAEGFTLPLSLLVIYDSYIHSGSVPSLLRNRFAERTPVRGGNEKVWVEDYSEVRRDWLATHKRKILHATAVRPKTFLAQMAKGNWDLSAPVTTQGITIP
ncbi:chitosanase [Chitinophaga niabensis]|uniref:Chitosanase n=1 Tax=Chitinophaga niabensis TaxID=536979 RepID=A0A1N6HBI9_9BACT|nr:chitosanase [Chitinophaga niabensis]SIO17029.1 chitosanase [Chitinophaga niabensis]